MAAIGTFNSIAPEGIRVLEDKGHHVFEGPSGNPEVILLRSHELLPDQIPESVQAIVRAGAGTNNIDVEDATKRGIVVMNTPGANANAVAELVIGSLFAASRNLFKAYEYTAGLGSNPEKRDIEDAKKRFSGHEIAGKTLGVVGLGAIGVRVANIATVLGLNVKAYETALRPENAHRLQSSVSIVDSEETVFRDADFVSLHVPLTEDTTGFVSEGLLKVMQPGGVLLNFARGELVDPLAMKAALDSGHAAKYVNDFPSSAGTHPDIISLPHLGASTAEAEANCAIMAATQIVRFLQYGEIVNSVNFPELKMAKSGVGRILILHRNVHSTLADISDYFGTAGINIAGSINQSRADVAASMFDLDSEADAEAVVRSAKEVQQHPNVLKLRVMA